MCTLRCDEAEARKSAINLFGKQFQTILKSLGKFRPIMIIGVIEIEEDTLFNTAIVIHEGQLIRKYRKTCMDYFFRCHY
jgi:predicted amidohydrolase